MAGADMPPPKKTRAAKSDRHVRPRHWLVVGGAPRSGTTALGRALDRSAGIALFHEYASHKFFAALDVLFQEERRHGAFADFNAERDAMPLSARDGIMIASDIFKRVSGKRTSVIGTKFPGHQLWPRPALPAGIGLKELMVVRNPLETVISSIEKTVREDGRAEVGHARDTAQHHWAHAWNYTLLREGDGLLPVIMDRVAEDPKREAELIATFLGIDNDLDLGRMHGASVPEEVEARYRALGLTALHEQLRASWSPRPWAEQVEEVTGRRTFYGAPLHSGTIDFTDGGDRWKYVQHGFYPPEVAGSWTCGDEAMIVFRLDDPQPGNYQLTLDVGWAPRIAGETTRIGVRIDNLAASEELVDLGFHPGQRIALHLSIEDFTPAPAGTCLRIRIDNPRSPLLAGESLDDRLLGFMLHSLRFERILGAR